MPDLRIVHEVSADGLRFRIQESGLFRKLSYLPVESWGRISTDRALGGISQLSVWCDEEDVRVDEDSVVVPHRYVAALSEQSASVLGLPNVAPYLLNLQHLGTLDQVQFRFQPSWLTLNGQRLLGARRVGAILQVGNKNFRLSSEIHEIAEATDAFNNAADEGESARLYNWSLVQELLPEASARSIQADGYIQSTRIAHAAAFSLDLRTGGDGFTFNPVLFSSKVADRTTSGPEVDGQDVVITEAEQLLPDVQQDIFVQHRFKQFEECQGRYALGDGWYVVFDDDVRRALCVVRKAQSADRNTRRDFVRNPRAFIRKAIGETTTEAALERLFIETAEFSDRVKDVGLWESVVLPWVQRTNDPWLPEKFGLRIGDKYISIDQSEVSRLKEVAQGAVQKGEEFFEWSNEQLPATEETLRAIESLVGLTKPKKVAEPPPPPGDEQEEQPPRSVVLVIDQNLTEIEFTRSVQRRAAEVDNDLPVSLKTTLKSHQSEGVRWLKEAWASGRSGVLLADDMGLGKTLQALTFLAWLRQRMTEGLLRRSPVLMVAPVALLSNWRAEHATHFYEPGIGNALVAYGRDLQHLRKSRGREVDMGEPVLDSHELQRADWILTTYETLRDYQHTFGALRFSAIVYDEVQKIKTPGTIMTHAAKAMNGDFLLALTGTPVENRLADLWCIMDMLQPGALGDLRQFSAKYEREPAEDDLRSLKNQLMQRQNSDPPSMVRRMKQASLQGLPTKEEHSIKMPMPPVQAQLYNEAINEAKASSNKGAMLKALQKLKSISLHPVHPDLAKADTYITDSARMSAAFETLDEIEAKNEKTLIFLESREMQPIVAGLIQRRYRLQHQPMLINGAVSGAKRQERVDAFQRAKNGFDVIILSPRAGGVGLTLTAANHVIHLSRWWNPAVEDQCTDRVYRIGQSKDVHVYFPMAVHPVFGESSFDLRLHDLLEKKRSLSREILMPPVDPDRDAANLFDETVGGQAGVSDPGSGMSLEDIDTMEPLQFEEWVLNALGHSGFDVSRTPRSHDSGADGIATSRRTGARLIIQCKHTQPRGQCNETAVLDLIRAKVAYDRKRAVFVAVTNAAGFTKTAQRLARENGIELTDRNSLATWPSCYLNV